MHNGLAKLWEKLRETFGWLFKNDLWVSGEIELLHGSHHLALPIEEYNITTNQIREVWVSLDESMSNMPICCCQPHNWFCVKTCCDEVRIDAKINGDKVLLKWLILA